MAGFAGYRHTTVYTHTHTCGSTGRWMGGVRAGCMPPPLKDSERGGREGSDTRLDTLCCSAGELCLFSLERSSTWDRVTHRRHSQSPGRPAEALSRLATRRRRGCMHARYPYPQTFATSQPDNLTCTFRGEEATGSHKQQEASSCLPPHLSLKGHLCNILDFQELYFVIPSSSNH